MRIAGLLQLQTGGVIQDAKGAFTYNLGHPKREEVIGADGVHGYKEVPQAAFVEGAITDPGTLDLEAVVTGKGVTITLQLANGKTVTLPDAWYAGEGTLSTEESELPVKWVSKSKGKEI